MYFGTSTMWYCIFNLLFNYWISANFKFSEGWWKLKKVLKVLDSITDRGPSVYNNPHVSYFVFNVIWVNACVQYTDGMYENIKLFNVYKINIKYFYYRQILTRKKNVFPCLQYSMCQCACILYILNALTIINIEHVNNNLFIHLLYRM